jgi:Zn-dependent oligopeptidase
MIVLIKCDKQAHRVWHDDVQQWSVHDRDTRAFLGTFYLDLHPRDGKVSVCGRAGNAHA